MLDSEFTDSPVRPWAARYEVTAMRTGRSLLPILILSLLACFSVSLGEESGGVVAILELSQSFYYAGEALEVRLSIGNDGDQQVSNPVKSPVFKGFQVKDDAGNLLRPTGKPDAKEPQRPSKLSPKGFYGVVVDLVSLYPQLAEPGRYEISWESGGVKSSTLEIRLIPRYDPSKNYRARIQTGEGTIVMDFFSTESPLAVKSFVDMANAGFYDGLLFHEVHPDNFVIAGDPRFGTGGTQPIFFPAEQSNLPIVSGTVVMKPAGAAPPANSSPFIIILRPRPEWTGQLTVLGQIVSGIEVVTKISRQPSTELSSRPNFKPLKDIPILGVEIVERADETGR
jgi:cyclophilin family peptidyl-prolyl cis-trans isomerase